jgi:hypothetical protein
MCAESRKTLMIANSSRRSDCRVAQHALQALAGFAGFLREAVEGDGGVHVTLPGSFSSRGPRQVCQTFVVLSTKAANDEARIQLSLTDRHWRGADLSLRKAR